MSRTPRDAHGTRKSRGTHGPRGAWGPSWSLWPMAAGLSEGIGQQWVAMLGDPGVRRSNRGWWPREARRPWWAWRSPLSRRAHSSSLARTPWRALWTWRASHPYWALASGVALGASGPREPPGTTSILEASIPRAALGSWRAPEWGRILGGSWGWGHCPLSDSQHCHLGLQHLQTL